MKRGRLFYVVRYRLEDNVRCSCPALMALFGPLRLLFPELDKPLDEVHRQGFVGRELDDGLGDFFVFEVVGKLLEQCLAPRTGEGKVFGKTCVIDQKLLADLESRDLIADDLLRLWSYLVYQLTDSLHPLLHLFWKSLVVFVNRLVICLRHCASCFEAKDKKIGRMWTMV